MTNVQQTSLLAYSEALKTLGSKQKSVLDVFTHNPQIDDWTNLEIANYLHWQINSVTPRVFELRMKGLLKERCKRTCSIGGRRAIAWELNK